jgi:exopolyphosphatase/guanosine-5'-triphosphate,3'-diphosphate pyrophosphatase
MAKPLIVAAIDVGSHDVIMKIAGLKSDEPPKIIDEVQRTIPMGADTYSTGKISQNLLNQTIEVLKTFNKKMEEYKVNTVQAAATSAFREAANQLFVVEQIRRLTGIEVEVLSSGMDSYYHQIALSETIPDFTEMIQTNVLIVNIGSGSIQLTLFNDGKYINTQNFRLGPLRIRELLGDLERHSTDFGGLMTEYISGELNYYKTFGPKRATYQNLIVLGGSSRYIKHVAGWTSKKQGQIKKEDFESFFEKLKSGNPNDLPRLSQVPTEQETLMLPTCIVIDEVLQFTGIDQLYISDIDLTTGMLYKMANELQKYRFKRDPDINRIESAIYLANRYRTDKKHSQHVSHLAVGLFDLTVKIHGLPKIARVYLEMAAILHNIGKYVSMENDGVRSYNIIQSNELIGLNERELEIVALTACFHNGRVHPNDPMLQKLTSDEKLMTLKLISILALANSLDAGHQQKIEIIKTRVEDDRLEIFISSDKDFTLELWNFNKHTGLFQALFGLHPEIRLLKSKKI